MRALIITENCIKNTINSLTVTDEIKKIINNIIIRFDYSYINFVYTMFSAYMNIYVNILDNNSNIPRAEVKAILDKFSLYKRDININQVFIADKLDIVYSVTCPGYNTPSKFKNYMYEDFYNRLENVLGVEDATTHMEDVFETIEFLINSIESNMIKLCCKSEDDFTVGNISIYMEVTHPDSLLILIT